MRIQTRAFRVVTAFVTLGVSLQITGCGGGGSVSGTTTVGDTVKRIAGIYQFQLQAGHGDYVLTLPGTSNSLTGTGRTVGGSAVLFDYSGTISNAGAYVVNITERGTANSYQVTGTITQDAFGNTQVGGTWTGGGSGGTVSAQKTSALAVSTGPVNSLIDVIDLTSLSPKGTQGVAVTPDGKTLFTVLTGNIRALDTASKTLLASQPYTQTPADMAITPDGRYLYIGGDTLLQMETSGSFLLFPTGDTGPFTWVTAPISSTDPSRVYFGSATKGGFQRKTTSGVVSSSPLVSLGSGNPFVVARAAATDSRLLVSTQTLTGAAAAGLSGTAHNTLSGPFNYTPALMNALSPMAASPDGKTFYSVSTASAPARIFMANMDTHSLVSSAPVGDSASVVNDLAVTPDGKRLLVVLGGNQRLLVLDSATLAQVQAIDLNLAPDPSASPVAIRSRIAVTSGGDRAYVAGQAKIGVVRLK